MSSDLNIQEKKAIIVKHGAVKEKLLNILLDIQFSSEKGYIDKETAALVADELGMTETRVFEVISYYAMLKDKPQAKYVLKICNSSPCYVTESDKLVALLEKELHVTANQATADGLFAFNCIPCPGVCHMGPIIKIKDKVFGNMNEQKVLQLLHDLREDRISL